MTHKQQELACQKKKWKNYFDQRIDELCCYNQPLWTLCGWGVLDRCSESELFSETKSWQFSCLFLFQTKKGKKINSSWVSSYEVWFGSHPVLLLDVIDLPPNIHESVKVFKAAKRQQEKLARKDLSPHCADTLPIHGKSFGWWPTWKQLLLWRPHTFNIVLDLFYIYWGN